MYTYILYIEREASEFKGEGIQAWSVSPLKPILFYSIFIFYWSLVRGAKERKQVLKRTLAFPEWKKQRHRDKQMIYMFKGVLKSKPPIYFTYESCRERRSFLNNPSFSPFYFYSLSYWTIRTESESFWETCFIVIFLFFNNFFNTIVTEMLIVEYKS